MHGVSLLCLGHSQGVTCPPALISEQVTCVEMARNFQTLPLGYRVPGLLTVVRPMHPIGSHRTTSNAQPQASCLVILVAILRRTVTTSRLPAAIKI